MNSYVTARLSMRLSWRHTMRRPIQSLFLILGVAIGVAMIVAIDLANSSAMRAFELGAETVTGRTTHHIVGGPTGVDEEIYATLRRDIGYQASAPVVEQYVSVETFGGLTMRLFGIDPFAEAPFRNYLGDNPSAAGSQNGYLQPLMVVPGSVLLGRELAERYAVELGDEVEVSVGSRDRRVVVVGLLEPADDLSRHALETLMVADIGTAQELLGRVGRLDRIDLIIPNDPVGQSELTAIEAKLPVGLRIEASSARNGVVSEMVNAFNLNLTALSLLALLVGMFLIYNTVTFSVIQRRTILGSLRALGMTRRQVFVLILAEAVILGLIGTLIGLGLGTLLGRGAVRLVTQTVNDLFFVIAVRDVVLPVGTYVKGAVIGVLAAAIGAAAPAYEAMSVVPAGAMQRSTIEERARAALWWVTGFAVLLLVIGLLILIPEWGLVYSFGGLFAIIVGSAMLTPVLVLAMMHGFTAISRRLGGVLVRMAPRYIVRSLSRTSVAVAALMVAVSVIIGVGIMINSFRATVDLWLDDVLQADIFISPPSLSANQVLTTLDANVVDLLADYPGIQRVATTRGVDVVAFLNGSAGRDSELQQPAVPVRLVAISEDLAGADRRYRQDSGGWRRTWMLVEAGGVVVNEPLANRYDLSVGDDLVLQTDSGPTAFPIVGIAIDFDVNAVAFMYDGVYRQWWDDEQISAVALFVHDQTDVNAKAIELRAALAEEGKLLVRSNRGMRDNALAVFDRTFSITVALQLLATIVAFIGILSTLMSLQLERLREIGVLRANGMTRGQLWRLSLLETGLIGASAGVLAAPTGLVLAAILIYIINLRSFGWTLTMQLQFGEFAQAFLVALVAALIAGLYPAWRIGRIQPAIALRAE